MAGIIALPAPRTKREVRQLLGVLGYCRQWIEEFSKQVNFLYENLTLNVIKWSPEDEEKFQHIKTL